MSKVPVRRKRLPAEERKKVILAAARQAFSDVGDSRGATTKQIADRAGIGEAMIYRHFETKEELFLQAVIEPLTETLGAIANTWTAFDPSSIPEAEWEDAAFDFFHDMVATLVEILPLLDMVLFGDSDQAERFYGEVLRPLLDRLHQQYFALHTAAAGYVNESASRVIGTFGVCLMIAVDQRLNPQREPLDTVARDLTEWFRPLWSRLLNVNTEARAPATGRRNSKRP